MLLLPLAQSYSGPLPVPLAFVETVARRRQVVTISLGIDPLVLSRRFHDCWFDVPTALADPGLFVPVLSIWRLVPAPFSSS